MAELLLVAPSSSKFFLNFSPGVPEEDPVRPKSGFENWTKKYPASHAETG
jgi:hypothetical protein